jgi:hypothetical protein
MTVAAFKLIDRHLYSPEWYNTISFLYVYNFCDSRYYPIHLIIFVKENQVMISEILLDMIVAGNIKITNIFRY